LYFLPSTLPRWPIVVLKVVVPSLLNPVTVSTATSTIHPAVRMSASIALMLRAVIRRISTIARTMNVVAGAALTARMEVFVSIHLPTIPNGVCVNRIAGGRNAEMIAVGVPVEPVMMTWVA